MSKNKQAGFGVVEVLLILTVLSLVGFVGWRLYEANKKPEVETATSGNDTTAIEKAEDLEAAKQQLNNEDVDSTLDTSEIDETLGQ